MTPCDFPKDGNFAAYTEGLSQRPAAPQTLSDFGASSKKIGDDTENAQPPRQTIQQVLAEGQEPTDEFLDEWNAQGDLPELSEEELARQALQAPGDDGDPHTPE